MGTDFNLPFSEIFGEGPVPTVDPVDLRSVWEMGRQMKNQLQPGLQSSSGVVIGAEFYERACSPGANVGAVWYRVSQISLLQMLGMLAPWIHEGVVADAVFKVAATFPMERVPIGVPRQGLPFDVEEFLSQVAAS